MAGHRATVNIVLRYVVTAVCAASAGVHAALIAPHLAEGGPALAGAFAAAALALGAAALAVRTPRHDAWAPGLATAVLAVIAAAYVLSRTSGVPLLIRQVEQPDLLGVLTSSAEAIGAVAGALLMSRKDAL